MLSNSDAAKYISIHASRKGSDHWRRRLLAEAGISIHASRKGSDGRKEIRRVFSRTFQSTLPAREATHRHEELGGATKISIHASRKGSDE